MSRLATFCLATLVLVGGSHAAERAVDLSVDTFSQRCLTLGGQPSRLAGVTACKAEGVLVECVGSSTWLSHCSWPGIEGRTLVARLIGMPSAEPLNTLENTVEGLKEQNDPYGPQCNPCAVL